MTKRLLLLWLLLGTAFCLGACSHPELGTAVLPSIQTSAPLPDSPLAMLYFSESASYFKRVQGYEFHAEEGAYTVSFYMANEEECYPVAVDQSWVDTLTGFIRQYNMMNWSGFSGTAPGLLDGTHFSIDFAFADGTAVHASGYGTFPSGYGDASEAIDAHFMQLLPQEMRDW